MASKQISLSTLAKNFGIFVVVAALLFSAVAYGGYLLGTAKADAHYLPSIETLSTTLERANNKIVELNNLVETMKNPDAEAAYYRAIYDLCYTYLVQKQHRASYDASQLCLDAVAKSYYGPNWYGDVSPGWDWNTMKKIGAGAGDGG